MPRDLTLKGMNAVHRLLLRATGGRAGWRAAGMPVVELTTRGRRTGRPRTVLLTSPLRLDGALVLVASRGGDHRPPAWLLNVRAHPEVVARVAGSQPRPMRARVADAPERARLWPLVTARHPGYARYQERTAREIALVILEEP